jgi:hypothetical protein
MRNISLKPHSKSMLNVRLDLDIENDWKSRFSFNVPNGDDSRNMLIEYRKNCNTNASEVHIKRDAHLRQLG